MYFCFLVSASWEISSGEDKSKEEIQAEQAAKKKKSTLSHSMMRELKSQMFDTPEEISHEADTRKQKYIQEEKEKAMYEEDMFTRLPVSKAEKQARRQNHSRRLRRPCWPW